MRLKPTTSPNRNTYENKGVKKEKTETEETSPDLTKFFSQEGKSDE